jgi:macrolide transport system ATP-binding/permease protein
MNFPWKLYRRLAQAFPHEFKMAFGDEMLLAGEEATRRLARQKGIAGFFLLLSDVAVRLPLEYFAEIRQDTRYAVRALAKSPAFALVGIASMGLGIGLTTAIYSSGWSVLMRPVPAAANASRLVTPDAPVSYPYIEQFREQKGMFAGIAAVQTGLQFNIGVPERTGTKPERVFGQIVSPDYFSVLGVPAARGRILSPERDQPGNAPVVVISDRFWRSRLNSDPDIIGQSIRVNGQLATIIGITPRKFDGALSMYPAELFVPTTAPASLAPELGNDVLRSSVARDFQALICLQPGVTSGQAEAVLDGITRRLDKNDPNARPQTDHGKRVVLLGAGTRVPMPRQAHAMVMGFYGALMAIVIAIACLNLATMLLARCANRRKELAIRLGVGASRFRLIRQMITEGILLSLLGGAAGFVLAYGIWVLNQQVRQPAGTPVLPDVSVDWSAALFAFVLSVVCGIGFSLVPAFQATRTEVAPALKDGAALQLSGYRRLGFRNLAIGAQVAGALMLLLVTGFLVLGILNGSNVHPSFNQNTMGFLSIDPVRDGYTPEQSRQFFDRLPERLRDSGKIPFFAFAAQPPFFSSDDENGFPIEADGSHVQQSLAQQMVGAGYFATLNEPLTAGREFEEKDTRNLNGTSLIPLILNQKAARTFFIDGNAVGKRLHDRNKAYEVVGVVSDTKDAAGMTQPLAFLPMTDRDFLQPPAGGITIIARSNSASDALNAVSRAVASLDPTLTPFNVQTLTEYLDLSRYAVRGALRTFGCIGLFGLLLSAIGLSGVTAYAVAQRRKEIGIRMVLGASKAQVLRLVLRESAALIAAGSVAGFLGAAAVARILASLTTAFGDAFAVATDDPRLLIGAPLLLGGLALLACYLPARNATKLNPLQAFRQE